MDFNLIDPALLAPTNLTGEFWGIPLKLNGIANQSMEINLTYAPYPTQASLDFWSFWTNPLGLALVAGTFLILGGIIAGGAQWILEDIKDKNQKRLEERNNNLLKKNNRIQAYSALLGLKRRLLYFLVTSLSFRNNMENLLLHSEIMAIELLKPKDIGKSRDVELNALVRKIQGKHPDYIESRRLREKEEKLELELAKVDEEFWKTIGQIKVYGFKNVDNLISEIRTAEEDLDKTEKSISEEFEKFHKEISTISGCVSTWPLDVFKLPEGTTKEEKVKTCKLLFNKWSSDFETLETKRQRKEKSFIEEIETKKGTLNSKLESLFKELKSQIEQET